MNVFVRILDCCVGYFLLQFTKKSTKFTSRKCAPLSPSISIRPKNSFSFALPYIHKFSHPRLTFSPKEVGNVLCHPSVPSDLNRGFIESNEIERADRNQTICTIYEALVSTMDDAHERRVSYKFPRLRSSPFPSSSSSLVVFWSPPRW